MPDFPLPGVLFKDIGPVLGDPAGLRAVIDALTQLAHDTGVDKVAGIEARGFLLASPVGVAAGIGVVPVRKAGKLPGATRRVEYDLEYGTATLEIQADAVNPGERILIIDDVLATGGTAMAAAALLAGCRSPGERAGGADRARRARRPRQRRSARGRHAAHGLAAGRRPLGAARC